MSIKDGCSSYAFPIHHTDREPPHTDGQLNMKQREREEDGEREGVYSSNGTTETERVRQIEVAYRVYNYR